MIRRSRSVTVTATSAAQNSDPTTAWPEDRETVVAGRLVLDTCTRQECDSLIFDPTRVVDGVECSDDPILQARSEAYGVSYARRTT